MAKITLTDIAAGYALISTINANNALIEAALENMLSRDGTTPNTMSADLDMNSQKVTNLLDGVNNQDSVTIAQLAAASIVASSALASAVSVADAGNLYTADTVEGILAELGGGSSGSFTGTLTGFTSNPTGTVNYRISNGVCTLSVPASILSASNATSLTLTGLPAVCTPITDDSSNIKPTHLTDNTTVAQRGAITVLNNSTITFGLWTGTAFSASGFTASGNKGLQQGWSISYPLD